MYVERLKNPVASLFEFRTPVWERFPPERSIFLPSQLKYRISRVRRKFGAPVTFTGCNALESKDKYTECTSYHDRKFSIERMEITTGVQAVPTLRSISTQTRWYVLISHEDLSSNMSNLIKMYCS